jgi:hypothetical protein
VYAAGVPARLSEPARRKIGLGVPRTRRWTIGLRERDEAEEDQQRQHQRRETAAHVRGKSHGPSPAATLTAKRE